MKMLCCKCDREYEEAGALYLGVPYERIKAMGAQPVLKYHVCPRCDVLFEQWLLGEDMEELLEEVLERSKKEIDWRLPDDLRIKIEMYLDPNGGSHAK